jgi:hypothetical protein
MLGAVSTASASPAGSAPPGVATGQTAVDKAEWRGERCYRHRGHWHCDRGHHHGWHRERPYRHWRHYRHHRDRH